MMSTLRVALLVLGALPVPACRDRAPQAPATSAPAAPSAVEAPAAPAPQPVMPAAPQAARTESAEPPVAAAGPADAAGEAGAGPTGDVLLVSERTLTRSRATLVSGRARSASGKPPGGAAPGAGPSVGAREVTASDSLPQELGPAEPARSRAVRPTVIVVLADHRVDPGTGVEHTSSLMYGAGFEATTRGWLSLRGELTTGTLAAGQAGVRDRRVTDARLDVGVAAFQWLTLLAGGGLRVYTQDAQENWSFIRVGAEAHFPLGVEALSGMVRFTLSPLVSRTTSAPTTLSPNFAMAGASGLQLVYRRLTVGLEYAIESYTFPSSGGFTRLEEFSGLKLRLGLNLGW